MGGGGKDVPHDSRRVLGDVTMTSMGGAVAPSGSLRHPDHPTAKNCRPPPSKDPHWPLKISLSSSPKDRHSLGQSDN